MEESFTDGARYQEAQRITGKPEGPGLTGSRKSNPAFEKNILRLVPRVCGKGREDRILLRRAGCHGNKREKIATGRFRMNKAAREGSSFSREVDNTINEGKLACSHRSCIGNNFFFDKAKGILHHYTVSL